ncbi:hypothetical protein P4H61_16305 [Paenibacillus peoriae]|uniref:hypothetical protein n=1 Tax=Paenibacillus peoriae TaxID=59893 RepID=UPI00026C5C8D|nr:hypothetical protein [Paenibacillus peoriae]MEC0183049.1 hypothetical protein [Paenibacillus peoriae]
MLRGVMRFLKANNFPWVTFKKYWRNSSRSELIVDVLVPFLMSSLLLLFTSEYVTNFKDLVDKFQQLSGQVIAAISILAGFNIASITIISTAGNSMERLRNTRSSPGALSVYEILIVFFTWAVIIQLIVVLISILLFYVGSLVPLKFSSISIPLWGWISATLWLTLTIHSVFISIRNMKTLFHYVTYNP